jgi:hypothetical protein
MESWLRGGGRQSFEMTLFFRVNVSISIYL